MLFLPYTKFTITTNLTRSEILQRLEIIMEDADNASFWKSYSKPYQGKILADRFKMSRNIYYRNSFLPVIIGQILNFETQTKIQIEMRLNLLVLTVMIAFLSITGVLTILMTATLIQNRQFSGEQSFPIIMFISMYLAMLLGYHTERKRAEKDITKLFQSL